MWRARLPVNTTRQGEVARRAYIANEACPTASAAPSWLGVLYRWCGLAAAASTGSLPNATLAMPGLFVQQPRYVKIAVTRTEAAAGGGIFVRMSGNDSASLAPQVAPNMMYAGLGEQVCQAATVLTQSRQDPPPSAW